MCCPEPRHATLEAMLRMVVHTEADLLAGVLHPAFLSSQVHQPPSSQPSRFESGQFLKIHQWTRFIEWPSLSFHRNQCRVSVRSGSADPYLWLMNPAPDPTPHPSAFFSDLKNFFSYFFSYNLPAGSVADPDPGSCAFLTPGSGIRNRFFPDPGSRIPDPRSRIPNPYIWEHIEKFLGEKFKNSLKIGPNFFL